MKKEKKKPNEEDTDNLTRLINKILQEATKEVKKIRKEAKLQLEILEKETQKLVNETKNKELEKEVSRFEFIKKRFESEYQQRAKRILIQSKEASIDEVFEKIEKEMSSFRTDASYKEYIKNRLNSSIINIKDKNMKILIDKKDKKLVEEILTEIKKRRETNFIIETSGLKTSGGFVLTDKEERIRIDHTIENLLEASRETIRSKINDLLFGKV